MPDNTSPANEVTLKVGAQEYGGWKAARATVGMDRTAGEFTLEVTDLWPGGDYTRGIRAGERCTLLVGGKPVISGYVDAVEVAIDGRDHVVNINGRDAAADLIDCSALHSPGQWRGQSVETIARLLADPFGVKVRADAPVGKPLESFSLQEGETVFEAIDRAARYRGLLVMSDGTGGVLLTRAGLLRAEDDLVLGQNLLQGRATVDLRDRFDRYVVKGQAPGTDLRNGAVASQAKAQATDPQVGRYRPLLVVADAPDTAAALADRAKWEATVRRAKSTTLVGVVQGFAQRSGELWAPNRLVKVVAEPLRLNEDLLISSVAFMVSAQGCFTELSLTLADAYTLEPIPAPAPAAKTAAAAAKQPMFDLAGPRR